MKGKKKISEETKWQIVAYHKLGMNDSKIGSLVNVSPTCIKTTIRNWTNNGSVKSLSGAGRPRITSPKDDTKLFNLVRRSPESSLSELNSKWLTADGSPKASKSTISRRLLDFNLASYQKADKPLLTDRDRQIRLAWCQERRNWSYSKWSNVIFSDESNFELINRKVSPTIRRFKHEKYDPKFVKGRVQGGGGSIGIWGCISGAGTGCCFMYKNRMDQHQYLEVLESHLLPSVEILIDSNDE